MSGLRKPRHSNCPTYSDFEEASERAKYKPKEWELYGGTPRTLGDGSVPPLSVSAPRAGYTLIAKGVKCPIPGSEDAIIPYKENGNYYWWDAGELYEKKG